MPGIDVPFHSSELHAGVADFRRALDELLPRDDRPRADLVGRYIPNLVPRLFTLDRDYVEEIADLVPAEPLDEVLEDWDNWRTRSRPSLCRKLLIELLAWQFASPVRWIETQDLLFIDRAAADSASSSSSRSAWPTRRPWPTWPRRRSSCPVRRAPKIVNSSRDAAVVFATDTDPEPEPETRKRRRTRQPPRRRRPKRHRARRPRRARGCRSSGRPQLHRCRRDARADRAATKVRLDQIEAPDTIEALCDGVSSRRNQLLVDLGAELSLGAIDGAAEADWPG